MPPAPRILLFDDDPAMRESLHFSLELQGFAVATFGTAEALLSDPRLSGADCLVLDYRLPGMDGLVLLKRVRDRGVIAPAIIVTTAATRTLRGLAAEAGAVLIEKPLLSDALTDAIRALVPAPAHAA